MTPQEQKTQQESRAVAFTATAINEELRTVELAFSSELPFPREFGLEVLSHDTADIDFSRLIDGRAPLLLEHDRTKQIGVVERSWVDSDRKCRAVVRFSKNEEADEVYRDVLDGIRSNVSTKYFITDIRYEKRNGETFAVCKWTPYEVSIVSVAVDPTVGVGRSLEEPVDDLELNKLENGSQSVNQLSGSQSEEEQETPSESRQLSEETNDQEIQETQEIQEAQRSPSITTIIKDKKMDNTNSQERALDKDALLVNDTARIDNIKSLARALDLGDSLNEFILNGTSYDQVRSIVQERTRSTQTVSTVSTATTDAKIGLTDKEVKQYSLGRAVEALITGDASKAGFELEVSRAVAAKAGKAFTGSFFIPEDYMRAAPAESITKAAGLVSTDYRSNSFIDLIYAQTAAQRAGVRFEQGLVGNVAFPKATSSANAYWVGDGADVTLSSMTFDTVDMAPKTVGAIVPITRQALLQSLPFLESLVQNHLRQVLAGAIDKAVFGNGGAGAPVGLGAITGLTTPAGSPTPFTYAALRKLILELENAGIFTDASRFVTNAGVANILSTTEQDSNTIAKYLRSEDGKTIGYETVISANVGDNLYFGNFADVLVGTWAGIELAVDTSQGFRNGSRLVRAMADLDVAVLRDESVTGYKGIDLG